MNFISTEEFRAMNPGLDLSKYDDATLSGVISRATAKVEEYLDHTLEYETITDEKSEGLVSSRSDITIYPRKYPVRSLISAKIVKGSFSADINLATSNYDIPSRGTEIVLCGQDITLQSITLLDYENLRLSDFYVVYSYTAGYELNNRPQILIEAVSLYAKDEIVSQQSTSGAKEIRQGGISIKYSDSSSKSDYIEDAQTLLTSLKRITGW